MGEVKKRKGEAFDALLRRFTRHLQSSGKILQAKKNRFKTKKASRNKRRESALYREEKRETYDYQIKTGQIKEDAFKRRKRR